MTNQATPDLRPIMFQGIEILADLVKSVSPDQFALATPCDDLNLGELIAHVNGAITRIAMLAEHQAVEGELGQSDSDPATFADEVAAVAERAIAGWGDDSLLDEMLTVPFGTMPGRNVVGAYASEVLVHAWDIAVTIGAEPTWPAEPAVEGILMGMQMALPAEIRGDEAIPFGQVIEIDDDAPAIERLAAWSGHARP